MTKSYPAEIVDGQIHWLGETPPTASLARPVDVVITVKREDLSPEELQARGERLKAAFEALRAKGGITSIPDPAAWQKEIRRDKPLDGRD